MILAGIAEAVSAGATRGQACAGVGLNARTVAVVEGTVAGVALGAVEQAWLAACWKAATGA